MRATFQTAKNLATKPSLTTVNNKVHIREKTTLTGFKSPEELKKLGIDENTIKQIQQRKLEHTSDTGIEHKEIVYSDSSDIRTSLGSGTHAPSTNGKENVQVKNESFCRPNSVEQYSSKVFQKKETVIYETGDKGEVDFYNRYLEHQKEAHETPSKNT